MNRSAIVILSTVTLILATTRTHARSEVCHSTSEKEIAALFDRWNASLKTGDPNKVVANYAAKSILLPTVSNKPRLTPEEKKEYFEHFLERKPFGTIDSRTMEIDCNTAVDAGLYTFKFGDGSEVRLVTRSRTSGMGSVGYLFSGIADE